MSGSDPGPREPVDQQRAQEVLDSVAADWLARQGVISVEVARRWANGAATDEVGIRVTLERLLPEDEVPEGQLFPDSVEGVPVDLREGDPPQLERPT
jgi:hypothetical protein